MSGRHRGEPKSRLGFFIAIGTGMLVLWAAMIAAFLLQPSSPAPAHYKPLPAMPSCDTPKCYQPRPRLVLPAPVRTYTAANTDSLWDAARRECGNGTSWKAMAAANKITRPWIIKKGQQLTVSCG